MNYWDEYYPNPRKKEEWFDYLLEDLWYRGTDAKGKGVGKAYMGFGLYLTWDRKMAEAFAHLAVEGSAPIPALGTKGTKGSKKHPPKLMTYYLQPNLKILDNRSKTMFKIKKLLSVNPWDKIDNPLFSRLLTHYVKEKGYDGIIDDEAADGLCLFDATHVELLETENLF